MKLMILFLLFHSLNLYSEEFIRQRENMVKTQIEARGIKNKKVLNAFIEVERHKFVPENLISYAYEDRPLPIGYGQTISQPYIVALMTELIEPRADFKVLEIGTGSGYQAAILSKLVREVYTVEIISNLVKSSKKKFKDLNLTNIHCVWSDGYYGWEENAPYDAIVVTCATEFVPPPLLKQLKKGGVMVVPVGPPFYTQELQLIKKLKDGSIKTKVIERVIFVSMTRELR